MTKHTSNYGLCDNSNTDSGHSEDCDFDLAFCPGTYLSLICQIFYRADNGGMDSYENTDPWRKFKADHGPARRDNWVWRTATLIVFAVLGAVIVAVAGALLNPRLPGEGHLDNLIFDSWSHALARMAVGALAGMAVGAVFVLRCWREMRPAPPHRNPNAFRD